VLCGSENTPDAESGSDDNLNVQVIERKELERNNNNCNNTSPSGNKRKRKPPLSGGTPRVYYPRSKRPKNTPNLAILSAPLNDPPAPLGGQRGKSIRPANFPSSVAMQNTRTLALRDQAKKMLLIVEQAVKTLDNDCRGFFELVQKLDSERELLTGKDALAISRGHRYLRHVELAQSQANAHQRYDHLQWELVRKLLAAGRKSLDHQVQRDLVFDYQIAAAHRCFGGFMAYSIVTLGAPKNRELLTKKSGGICCSFWRTRFTQIELMSCNVVKPTDVSDCRTLAAVRAISTHQLRITKILNSAVLDRAGENCRALPNYMQLLSIYHTYPNSSGGQTGVVLSHSIWVSPFWKNTIVLGDTSKLIAGKDIDDFVIVFSPAERAAAPHWLSNVMTPSPNDEDSNWHVICRVKGTEGLEQFTFWQTMLRKGIEFMMSKFAGAAAAQITFLSPGDIHAHGR
jgi:hypothetical protein